MKYKNDLIQAIHKKLLVDVTFDSYEKGEITRICVPFDFGPSRRYKDGRDRLHFYDLSSPDGKHNLSILPEQVIHLGLRDESFNPEDYITYTPVWFISRDWGINS